MSVLYIYFFFKQKTAYEMRISDWSSDVCSSDLRRRPVAAFTAFAQRLGGLLGADQSLRACGLAEDLHDPLERLLQGVQAGPGHAEPGVAHGLEALERGHGPDRQFVLLAPLRLRGPSEERRVGKECVRTCRSRG